MRLLLAVSAIVSVFMLLPAGLAAEPAVSRTSFELYDLNDKLFSLDRVLGDPATDMVVVDFFSMSCAPCKRAMPRLAELQKLYGAAGLRVVVVAIPAGNDRSSELERVRAFFQPINAGFPIVFDKYSVVARQYSVTDGKAASLPVSFVIDRKGKVARVFRDMESVVSAIESRFAGKMARP